jgi:uncharacterized membrane protein YfcA
LAWSAVSPAALSSTAFLVQPFQLRAALVQVAAHLVEGSRALVQLAELGVQPGFPLRQPGLAALQVGPQFPGFLADRTQFLVCVPAGLRRLVRGLPGFPHDRRSVGFRPRPDLFGIAAGFLSGLLGTGGELGAAR